MKTLVTVLATILILLSSATGCATSDNKPIYSGPFFSEQRESNWQKTTLHKLESLLNAKLPLPTYLPSGHQIKEVYYYEMPNSSPRMTQIWLLISDQPVRWENEQFTCRLLLNIGWYEPGLGLKMPWAQFIPEVRGRLEDKDGNYVLWWELDTGLYNSTLKLYSSNEFSRDELVKIAVATFP